MHLVGVSLVIQLICAIHCVRNGRSGLWLMVILFLSIPGCLAYAFFEILPQYSGRREVRAAKAAAVRRLDPERDIRAARDALDVADTAASRNALGDALADAGLWVEAVPHYREALAETRGADQAARLKLARALLEAGDAAAARPLLETLPPSASGSENDRAALLLARAFEETGEMERALALYEEIGARMAGGEAHCRRAALLIAKGRGAEAVAPLEEVAWRAKRLDRFERARDGEMYDWAERTLAELRGG
ncbi:MAG: tetratricopeptide repeat protein [Allosphingosinicella sp.]